VEAVSLLPREGTVGEAWNGPREEKFIPVTRRSLVRWLGEEEGLLSWEEREKLEVFAAALDARFSQRFQGCLKEAKYLYDAMDPDKDTVATLQLNRKQLLDREHQLLLQVRRMLDKANYFQVPRSELRNILQDHDADGLRVSVDPSIYDTLQIWTRGRSQESWSRPRQLAHQLWCYLRRRPVASLQSMYTRVFVAVRFKSEKKLHLKVFKDVVCDKLEHLLPDGKIKMSKYDKWFLAGSVAVGSCMVGMRSVPTLASYHLHWTWVGLGLAALAGTRAWVGYRNKRNKYLANLAATLYFKTVANNRGVLTLLADRAVDEEFKEAFLAYVFLLSPNNRRGVPGTAHTALPPSRDTAEGLRHRVEQWLGQRYKVQGFRFDIDDALDKLSDLGLLIRHTDSTLSVLDLKDALSVLPSPVLPWGAMGALRDSESADEGGGEGGEAEHKWR
jgi:hypothetical protein